MITLTDIRRLVDRLTKKEQRGNIISGEDFNTFLRISNAEHFDAEKRKADATNDVIDSLRLFLTIVQTSASSGVTLLPADYGKLLSAQRLYNGDYVRCDTVSQLEKEERQTNSLTEASDKYPIASVEGIYLKFFPTTTASVTYVYYKKPTDPFLDWYINTSDVPVYLAASATHVWATGETDSSGTTHTIGDPNWSSLTTELEWADNADRIAIAYRILAKVGVTIPNNLALELGVSEIMKSDNKV